MTPRIRRVRAGDIDAIVRLSLLAWAPVFASFERILGGAIYARLYPDWETSQRVVVEEICREPDHTIAWVADLDGTVAGFIAYTLNLANRSGEIELLAVHPDHQGRGIGTRLNTFALGQMEDAGMQLAVAATGGDPSHAPARRSYENAGYIGLPLVRFYKDL